MKSFLEEREGCESATFVGKRFLVYNEQFSVIQS